VSYELERKTDRMKFDRRGRTRDGVVLGRKGKGEVKLLLCHTSHVRTNHVRKLRCAFRLVREGVISCLRHD
jgi:hypothetical protein